MLSWAHVPSSAQVSRQGGAVDWHAATGCCFLSITTHMPTLVSTPSASIIQCIVYGRTFQKAVPSFSWDLNCGSSEESCEPLVCNFCIEWCYASLCYWRTWPHTFLDSLLMSCVRDYSSTPIRWLKDSISQQGLFPIPQSQWFTE